MLNKQTAAVFCVWTLKPLPPGVGSPAGAAACLCFGLWLLNENIAQDGAAALCFCYFVLGRNHLFIFLQVIKMVNNYINILKNM